MFNNSERGVSLIITFFILTIILAVVLSISIILYREIKIIRSIGNSVVSFYAADSGIEKTLYYDRKEKSIGVKSGICAMCDSGNPTCPGDYPTDQSVACICNYSTGSDCDPQSCESCEVSFYTNLNSDKNYYVTVNVSTDNGISNLSINSTGDFKKTKRAIQVFSTKEEEISGLGWLEGWSHRKRIIIENDYIDADLTDFPLYVKILADSDMVDALGNGNDIRFTLYDGTTLLKYEKESWGGGDGYAVTADFWVKIPLLSSVIPTSIYVYYGNATALDGQDTTNTWNSGYKGVWHLSDEATQPASEFNDSTINTNDANIKNSTGPVVGAVYFAEDFSGGYANTVGNPNSLKISNGTISSWIRTYDAGISWRAIVVKGNAYGMFLKDNILTAYDWSTGFEISTSIDLSDNTWYYATETFQSGVVDGSAFYIDGNFVKNFSMDVLSQPYSLEIARGGPQGSSQLFLGVIDEVRVSSNVLSADWIKFEYHNMVESDNELIFGDEE
ncbi:MAG: DUF2341 domain-containing protein [Patescibacteria group bacterium]